MVDFGKLESEQLADLLEDAAKLWLAHDGLWFQAVESVLGMEMAIRLDEEAMARFTVLEAKRIQKRWQLPKNSGLDGLHFALERRLYAHINEQQIERVSDRTLILRMIDCRVQAARRRKGMDAFPCRSVGMVEYQGFAQAIDEQIETECLSCPPQVEDDSAWCAWQFTLDA